MVLHLIINISGLNNPKINFFQSINFFFNLNWFCIVPKYVLFDLIIKFGNKYLSVILYNYLSMQNPRLHTTNSTDLLSALSKRHCGTEGTQSHSFTARSFKTSIQGSATAHYSSP